MNKFKKLGIILALSVAIIGSVWAAMPSQARHCDSWINIVSCGTYSHQELKNTYYSRSDIRALYNWSYINDSMINGNNMVEGTVYKDGRVVANGRVVATNAKTVQRNTNYPASSYGQEWVGGHKYYKFTTQNSFKSNAFKSFVWLDNSGKFIAAVIQSCGNPVWATPTPPPAPVYTCNALTANVSSNKASFSVKYSYANGATYKNTVYKIYNEAGKEVYSSSNGKFQSLEDGKYTAKAFVTFSVNGQDKTVTSDACAKSFTITTPKPPVPPKPPVKPTPVYKCESMTGVLNNSSAKFYAKHKSTGNVAYKNTVYVVYDKAGKEVAHAENGEFNNLKPGTYLVKAFVTFSVNGKDVAVTSDRCSIKFRIIETPTPPKPHLKKPGIDIDKKVDNVEQKTVDANTEFTYQIRVSNTGQIDLKDVSIRDVAPEGVVFIKASQGSIKNGTWTHTISKLKVNQHMLFTVTAKVPSYRAGNIKNTVCVNTPDVPNKPNSDNDGCDSATVKVKKELVKSCNLKTGVIEQVEKGQENSSNHSTDLTKCDKIEVCDLTTKKIVKVTKHEAQNSTKYGESDSKVCNPEPSVPPITITPGTPSVTPPTNPSVPSVTPPSTPSESTPGVPDQLPQTGMDLLLSGVGLTALVTAGTAYIASRRRF